MTLYTRRPERFHATVLTTDTTSADLQALYQEAGETTGTVTVTQLGATVIVQTSAREGWTGVFAPGDLVRVIDGVFGRVEPAEEYAPYTDLYVGTA